MSLRLSTARTGLALTVASCVLAACSVLPKSEPVTVWQPEQAKVIAAPATPPGFSLRVDTPNTSGVFDGTGIVVMPGPGQVSTYKGARWSEAPGMLVRHRLVDAFMAAGLPAVTTEDDHFAADYSLSGDLRAFQAEYRGGSPVVVVRLDAQLRRGFSRNLLATHSFVVTETPAGAQVPQIVAAFGTADDKLAQEVVAWTIDVADRNMQAHPESPAPPRRRGGR